MGIELRSEKYRLHSVGWWVCDLNGKSLLEYAWSAQDKCEDV